MAKLGGTFDSTKYEDPDDFEVIPPGWYRGMIEESDLKQTAARDGKYVWLKVRVHGPTHANRVVFDQINLINPSEKATEIGRRRMSQMARSVGRPRFSDTEELHNIMFEFKLKVRKDEGYEPKNEIVSYRPVQQMQRPATGGGGDAFGSSAASAPASSSKVPSFTDDEIPF